MKSGEEGWERGEFGGCVTFEKNQLSSLGWEPCGPGETLGAFSL